MRELCASVSTQCARGKCRRADNYMEKIADNAAGTRPGLHKWIPATLEVVVDLGQLAHPGVPD